MTTQIERIFPDSHVSQVCMTPDVAASSLLPTLLSESLPDVSERSNQPKALCFQNGSMVKRPLSVCNWSDH